MAMNDQDEKLMSLLEDALAQEAAVPEHRRTAARGAFAWRTIDDELLTLTHDALVGADSGVRAGGQLEARIVSFEGSVASLELELVGDRVTGQVQPARACTITAQSTSGDGPVIEVDDSGFFEADAPSERPVRWRIEIGGWVLISPWLT